MKKFIVAMSLVFIFNSLLISKDSTKTCFEQITTNQEWETLEQIWKTDFAEILKESESIWFNELKSCLEKSNKKCYKNFEKCYKNANKKWEKSIIAGSKKAHKHYLEKSKMLFETADNKEAVCAKKETITTVDPKQKIGKETIEEIVILEEN